MKSLKFCHPRKKLYLLVHKLDKTNLPQESSSEVVLNTWHDNPNRKYRKAKSVKKAIQSIHLVKIINCMLITHSGWSYFLQT